MTVPVPKDRSTSLLRVAVLASEETRRAELAALVAAAGHVVVVEHEADVVLLGSPGLATERPALMLGDASLGHAGWLRADASAEQIDAALRAVAVGLSVRPAVAQRHRGFEELAERTAQALLTPRELDVLAAIGAGLSNKAIARQLGISLHTVKFHIESLLRKLGARTRAEAVAKGLERRAGETVEL